MLLEMQYARIDSNYMSLGDTIFRLNKVRFNYFDLSIDCDFDRIHVGGKS